MHVIFTISQPFNEYFVEKFNIKRLLNDGFIITIFDLSDIHMPKVKKSDYKFHHKSLNILFIDRKKTFVFQLSSIKNCKIAVEAGNRDPWVRYILNELGIKVFRFQVSGMPLSGLEVFSEGTQSYRAVFVKILTMVKRRGLPHVFFKLCSKIKDSVFIKFKKPFIDILVLGAERHINGETLYIRKRTKIIKAHVADVDKYNLIKDEQTLVKKNIVFIDQMITHHPDLFSYY